MSAAARTAIVTGASGGIGRAISTAFLDEAFNVVLNGTNAEQVEAAEAELAKPARTHRVVADVASAEGRAHIVEGALKRFGRIDILINNAGIFEPRSFLEVDEAYLDRFFAVNLKGTYFLTQAVIPHLRAVGGGAVINIGTVLVDHAIGGVPATAPIVSKGAIHALTRQLAAEFGAENIRVNTIAPGIIRTPMHARNGIKNADSMGGLHLVKRIGEAEEIARAAVLLASNEFITGATLNIDGGHAAGHSL